MLSSILLVGIVLTSFRSTAAGIIRTVLVSIVDWSKPF